MVKKITLGISGASGMPLAFKLLQELNVAKVQVSLLISQAGIITIKQECDLSLSNNPNVVHEILCNHLNLVNCNYLKVYGINDWFAPMASGSGADDAMVICPCSMATLAKVANGVGDDLLLRAADVILKERKNLVLVPRETPLSPIHLQNMLTLANIGVSILPPMPAYYLKPTTIDDVTNFVVCRILDQLKISNQLINRWGSD